MRLIGFSYRCWSAATAAFAGGGGAGEADAMPCPLGRGFEQRRQWRQGRAGAPPAARTRPKSCEFHSPYKLSLLKSNPCAWAHPAFASRPARTFPVEEATYGAATSGAHSQSQVLAFSVPELSSLPLPLPCGLPPSPTLTHLLLLRARRLIWATMDESQVNAQIDQVRAEQQTDSATQHTASTARSRGGSHGTTGHRLAADDQIHPARGLGEGAGDQAQG